MDFNDPTALVLSSANPIITKAAQVLFSEINLDDSLFIPLLTSFFRGFLDKTAFLRIDRFKYSVGYVFRSRLADGKIISRVIRSRKEKWLSDSHFS